jgi:probable F420-dependent oxidoreductase
MSFNKERLSFGLAFGLANPKIELQKDNWKDIVTEVEALGFSGIFIPDHFRPQWDPIATMSAIAAVTKNIDIGSTVFCVDYRHPVVYAKASATINLISNNRHIFGIGAGWDLRDYKMSGIPFDKAVTRIKRLEEALQIINGMWTQESTSFEGEYYKVENLPKAVDELEYAKPRLMIGGGGKMMLSLAGRCADIVNIAWRYSGGADWLHKLVLDGSSERLGEKVDVVKQAAVKAGRDPDELVLSQWIASRRMFGDLDEEKRKLAEAYGSTLDEINNCTWIMAGEPKDVVENFRRRYEDYGISHYILDGGDSPNIEDLKRLSETVVKPLS